MIQDEKKWDSSDSENDSERENKVAVVGDMNVKYYVPGSLRQMYSEAEIESFRSQFKILDEDGSGSLCREELASLFSCADEEVSPAELDELIRSVDKDGSNTLSFAEFLELVSKKRKNDPIVKRFASAIKTTPTLELDRQCKKLNLQVKYNLEETRDESSFSLTKVFVIRCEVSGIFRELRNHKCVAEKKTKTFYGLGPSTKKAKFQAASLALSKIQHLVPSFVKKPGDIPPKWFEWARLNMGRGVPCARVCSTLIEKGFQPILNRTFMHTCVCIHKFLLSRDQLSELTSHAHHRDLPHDWKRWARQAVGMGLDGSIVLSVLEREGGFEPKMNPEFSQRVESNRFLYESRP